MKTIEQFIKEIDTSRELQEELKNLRDKDAVATFLKKHDCSATTEELAEAIKAKAENGQGELSDDDASAVSGGLWMDIGFGRFWIDETLPERKQDPILPDSPIIIIEDED